MKKTVLAITVAILVCACLLCFVACSNENQQTEHQQTEPSVPDNPPAQVIKTTHTQRITTATDFEKFFTYSNNATYSTYNDDPRKSDDASYTKSTLTINISPRIAGFVEYSGKVSFKIVANEESTGGGHNNEIITTNIFYTGETSMVKNYQSDIYKDESILLPHTGEINGVYFVHAYTLEVSSVDITVTYHHEGLSGDYSQTYHTINVTKYNYKSYLFGRLKNSAYYVTVKYDTGESIELTINGLIPESKNIDGTIIDVTGTIDIYPSATI